MAFIDPYTGKVVSNTPEAGLATDQNRYTVGPQKGLSMVGAPSYIDPTNSANTLVNTYNPSTGTGGITLGADQASGYGLEAGTYTPEQLNVAGNKLGTPNTGLDLKTGLAGVQAAAGLLNAYTGLQGLGLAKDQFGFKKASTNRNVANQAKLTNNSILNSAEVGNSLAGSTMNDAQRTASLAKAKSRFVDGSKIG